MDYTFQEADTIIKKWNSIKIACQKSHVKHVTNFNQQEFYDFVSQHNISWYLNEWPWLGLQRHHEDYFYLLRFLEFKFNNLGQYFFYTPKTDQKVQDKIDLLTNPTQKSEAQQKFDFAISLRQQLNLEPSITKWLPNTNQF